LPEGRVLRLGFSLNGNSEMLKFSPVEGPGSRSTYRIKPGGSLGYSEAFLDNTLGIAFTYGETHSVNPTHNNSVGYTAITPGTAVAPITDSSPMRLDTSQLVDGPQVKDRRNASLKVDYKLGRARRSASPRPTIIT